MFKLNLKIALRTIWKHKLTTSIKLTGLIVGLCTVVVLVAYVMYELSYDKAYVNAHQLYRIQAVNTEKDRETINLPSGLGDMLVEELPEISMALQMRQNDGQVKVGNEFYNERILVTEPSFFKMFTPDFIVGNPNKALIDDNSIVISSTFAKKSFPKGDALNKTLQFQGDDKPSLIVGIIKDLPKAAHFNADIIRKTQVKQKLNWSSYSSMPQYIQIKQGSTLTNIEAKIKSLYKKYDFPRDIRIKLLPITKIHLYSHATDEFTANSDIKYVYIFSVVAILILLIAIVNFVNLTIAASLKRAKEIGLKKVMGASIGQLRLQFLSESYLYFIISTLIVLILAHDLIPILGNKIGISISLKEMVSVKVVFVAIAIIITSGFVAGLYPAIILSRLMPVKTLKGYTSHENGKIGLKKFLMVFQFSISAFLIVCTLIINTQLNFIRHKNLGFDTDKVLVSSFNFFRNGYSAFKEEMLKNPSIKSISMASFSPGLHYGSSSSWSNDKDTIRYELDFIHADLNFISTLNIPVVKGRAFSAKFASDILNYDKAGENLSADAYKKLMAQVPIVLNEAAVKILNLKNPIDTVVSYGGLQGKIIGVVKDFNGMSLHNQVKPLAIRYEPTSNYGYMYIKIKGDDLIETKNEIYRVWKKTLPNDAPDFEFIDQHLQKLYQAEIRLGSIFVTFSAIAIFLCMIGLFGMVYFDLQQRTKEIAVRKILGASIKDLLRLLNRSFVKVVLISNLIIWPLAYYLTKEWLATFYYSTSISYQPFVIALITCLILTISTVSLQAIKLLRKSPVDALKYE
jgi:putative ABC transport system permease protein